MKSKSFSYRFMLSLGAFAVLMLFCGAPWAKARAVPQ